MSFSSNVNKPNIKLEQNRICRPSQLTKKRHSTPSGSQQALQQDFYYTITTVPKIPATLKSPNNLFVVPFLTPLFIDITD